MIGLDTNILARYYIEDRSDAEAERQRIAACRLMESGQTLMVCKTVILELEWLMRGYYAFGRQEAIAVVKHLLGQMHIVVEDRAAVERALAACEAGLDFADALHHACFYECDSVASFDDRKFARRAKRLGLSPSVFIPR
ncbi:type II toxin-antitoxin system VapC family toxin [Rugamonas sp. DEMB1]|uniref:type II toxin-antitoxin system VapC family toxin n=1 Tax=Rugamonas sp. DEMB1 TaxID=3039386 RepID=UPI0024476DB2|nr:type II toxin-antitoxin system VapC family toxin [Rugamonas sp. DEMB1]WGG51552.1 type II toxin-antitoxin system VapC family toxin [Rugamonas sp. DEMB1]